MALLEHLPNELFVQILSNLSNRDLASASRVSCRLHTISQPILYQEPHLTTSNISHCSFRIFARTLLTPGCEYLGTFVYCLTIDWKTPDLETYLADQRALAAREASGSGDKFPSEIVQVTLLLPLLPRLNALHLLRPDELNKAGHNMSWHPPPKLEAPPPVLQSLRDFTYEWMDPSNLIDITNLLTLLRLPHIRSIEIPGWYESGWGNDEYASVTAAAATSSLTHLTIQYRCSLIQTLPSIMNIPRWLTHLEIRKISMNYSAEFHALGLALVPVRHSLTSLIIECCTQRTSELNNAPTTTIGSLRDWPALRSLKCALVLLLGTDSRGLAEVLPPGIRELEIFDADCTPVGLAVTEVVGLLAAKDMVPALETVAVCIHRQKSKSLRKRLRKACWAAGVALLEELAG